MKQLPDKRVIERVLRESGLSARQAKRLLSGGWRLVVGEEQAALDDLHELKMALDAALQNPSRRDYNGL